MFNEIPVYMINLHNRTERLVHCLQQLRKVDLHKIVTRIEACTSEEACKGQHLYISQKAYQNIKNPRSTLILPNYKALGCAISHIEAWKAILSSGFRHGIVVEDDIEIKDPVLFKIEMNKMKQLISNIITNNNNNNIKYNQKPIFITFNAKINNNSDFYYYETTDNYIINYTDSDTYFKKISGQFTGTHFYYIDANMIKYLLEKFERNRLTYQIDIQIYNFIKEWNLYNSFTYNLKTNSIIQSPKFPSDVQWYNYSVKSLSIVLKLPTDVSQVIFNFMTNFTKKNNEILFNDIYMY